MTTNNLFKKVMCFSDIHLGLRHNSKDHNEDCLSYIEWFIAEAKSRNVETCIFLGDFFHHRNTINAQTLEYAIKLLSRINESFNKTYFMVGNHDLYFRDSRSVTSMKFATLFPNIVLIDSPTISGNVALIPWLIEDEWKTIADINSKYLFGHLELPGFKMNAHVEMPDHGNLNSTHFTKCDYAFSGHFHKRQTKGNITYIGNPFGHNYSDVWDFERGAMYLEWDKEPKYIDYADGPRFISIGLSALMDNLDLYLKPKTYLQVILDTDITYEDATFLRETFLSQYSVREFKLVRNQEDDLLKEYEGNVTMKTVDTIVIECINTIESTTIDSNKLIEIYNSL
jgi:DNA repair exonuclease SbcCD nuclease subunit